MGLLLETINPLYLLIAGGVFMIILGCACYGCHDLYYVQFEAGGEDGIACDASDCGNPDIHEQHLTDITKRPEGQQAWGMDSHFGDYPSVIMCGDF